MVKHTLWVDVGSSPSNDSRSFDRVLTVQRSFARKMELLGLGSVPGIATKQIDMVADSLKEDVTDR